MKNKVYRSTIAKDGSTAASRIGVNPLSISEIYNALVMMSWAKFFMVLLIPFFCLTLLFTVVNTFTGFENFSGLTSAQSMGKFLQLFFFNAQTLTTVGGAGIVPIGFTNNIILTIESMSAMLGAAVITGLFYARFSRPSTGIVYSRNALIAPYQDGKAIMFRVANRKRNEVVELNAAVFLVINDLVTNKREIQVLNLERAYLPFLAHAFTLVHPLTDKSPLKDLSLEDNDKTQYEIAVWFNAIDRITGQNVFSGHTYFMPDIIRNARFVSCMDVNDSGHFLIYLNKLNDYEMV
jgi:inward rectifier potassium channel